MNRNLAVHTNVNFALVTTLNYVYAFNNICGVKIILFSHKNADASSPEKTQLEDAV